MGDSGRVYALDIDEGWVRHVRDQAQRRGLEQIEAIRCPADDTTLADESVDVVFIANTIHHIDDVPAYVAHLHGILVPGGRCIVIDARYGRFGHNSDPERIGRIGADAGFTASTPHFFRGTDRYLLVLVKPARPG